MVILSMHVIGNGASHSDQLRTGRDGKQPPIGNGQALNVLQQHPGLAGQHAILPVKCDQMIQSPSHPQEATGIQAGVTVATPHAERHAWLRIPKSAGNGARRMQRDCPVKIARQTAPGTDRPHEVS